MRATHALTVEPGTARPIESQLRLADHIHALVDLLQQIAKQAGDAFQRGIGDLGRRVAGQRVAGDFHQIDDRERPVAERDVATDGVEAIGDEG